MTLAIQAGRLVHQRPQTRVFAAFLRFRHTLALARALPLSFGDALSQHHGDSAVDMHKCHAQHEHYLAELRSLVPTLCLPALEEHPDGLFLEDTVVAIGKTALLTKPGHASRQGEVVSTATILQQLGMNIMDDLGNDQHAVCDGGDVLYTGRHLFVGLSQRTNWAAVNVFRRTFHDVEVVPVAPVVQGLHVLHLKSAVTHLDERTLLVPQGMMGDKILDAMQAAQRGYVAVPVPNVLSANAVVVVTNSGTTVIAQDACEASKNVLQRAATNRGMAIRFVDTTELAKKDAALTCCSVLLSI